MTILHQIATSPHASWELGAMLLVLANFGCAMLGCDLPWSRRRT